MESRLQNLLGRCSFPGHRIETACDMRKALEAVAALEHSEAHIEDAFERLLPQIHAALRATPSPEGPRDEEIAEWLKAKRAQLREYIAGIDPTTGESRHHALIIAEGRVLQIDQTISEIERLSRPSEIEKR